MFLGKIIGVLLGYRFMGPIGAIAGLALGHWADAWIGARIGMASMPGFMRDLPFLNPAARRQNLFTESVVALSAKLAKADGPVNRAEVEAFKAEFRIQPGQLGAIGRLYDRAKQSAAGYESYARNLGAAFADTPMLLAGVFDALRRIAIVDGPLHPSESEFLAAVATAFHLKGAGASATASPGAEDPYAVLGVARDAPMDAIKAAWRDLTRQHHPDTLMAKGLPREYVELATRKMAEINAAYDRIRAERGEA